MPAKTRCILPLIALAVGLAISASFWLILRGDQNAGPDRGIGDVVQGIATASDGDTLRIGDVRIRIFGIDAPESHQDCDQEAKEAWHCGTAAADRLRALIADQTVTCVIADKDRYGRVVARCSADGADIGAQMVGEGFARAYTRFGDDYAAVETQAKTDRIGLWRGQSQAPWDYRAEVRQEAVNRLPPSAPPEPGCLIKGNVSTSGAHVYHMPGGRFYEKTRIDPRRGEAWFCDENSARIAGFRPSAE